PEASRNLATTASRSASEMRMAGAGDRRSGRGGSATPPVHQRARGDLQATRAQKGRSAADMPPEWLTGVDGAYTRACLAATAADMPPEWLTAVAWAYLVACLASTAVIVLDVLVRRHRQMMKVMEWVWPVTALYLGPFALWAYLRHGRQYSPAWREQHPDRVHP